MGRAIVGVIGTLVLMLVGVELLARLGFDRISRIQTRMREERVLAMHSLTRPQPHPTLLLVGNSVVLEGVDFPAFRESLGPQVEAYRYVIEQTTYYDWYYGLRRMFREGMRPTYLVVGFSAPHLNATTIRGDYSAHYLFDSSGVVDYARVDHLDLTTASSLLFAHYSRFFSARSEIRAFLMNKIFPAYGGVLHGVTNTAAPDDTDEHVASIARERLRALNELAGAYGTKLVFVVMPTGQPGENGIVAAGQATGTTVLLPVRRAVLKPEDFADTLHLNARGRHMFTQALTEALRSYLDHRSQIVRKTN